MKNPDKQLEFWRTWIILLFLPFIFWLIPGLVFTAIAIYLLNRELKKSWYVLKNLAWQDWSDNRKIFLKDIKKRYNIKVYTDNTDNIKETDAVDNTKINNDIEEKNILIEQTSPIRAPFIKKIKIIFNIIILIIFMFGIIESWIIDSNRIKEKISIKTSINFNDLFSWNSIRIRIILAILVAFIIFKVVKAIIDSKKYNKDSFKS